MTRVLVFALLLAGPVAHAADVEAGRATYAAKCQACHGKEGKGDGPATVALPKPPPDMTTAAFWRGRTAAQIEAVIKTGSPKGVMRAFPMPPEQLQNLVAYLQTFRPAP